MKRDEIRIKSDIHEGLNSIVLIEKEKYLVQTESGSPQNSIIISRIYLNGKIISTIKTNYKDIDASDESKISELMRKQHRSTIDNLKQEKAGQGKVETVEVEKVEETKEEKTEGAKPKEAKTPAEYLNAVKILLMRKNPKNAFLLLREAIDHHPNDPFLLSYYGCLDAIVNKNYKAGIDTCSKAIGGFKGKMPFGEELFYPVLYLNLGRAYLAAGKRKNAIDAFTKGLSMDRENGELLRELKRLGVRKKPPIAFLKRSNPINKYVGILLHKLSK